MYWRLARTPFSKYYGDLNMFFSLEMWRIWQNSFPRKSFVEIAAHLFFGRQVVKFQPPKKKITGTG